MRRVLVCTADRVLAKRVRFLLARDDTEVEILDAPGELDAALERADHDLVVVSRELDGEDAVDRLADRVQAEPGSAIMVLGGAPRPDEAGLRVVTDLSDPQAIVGAATSLMATAPSSSPALPHFEPETEQTMRLESSNDETGAAEASPSEATTGEANPAALARRFYACAARGLTGHLELTGPDETLTFHLDEGRPVHMASS